MTWEITINKIKEKYPEAEVLLRGMSCLAATPNTINQSWLEGVVVDEQVRMSSLGELTAYSMIEKHQDTNNFLVHALVQEVVYINLSVEEKQEVLTKTIGKLINIFPFGKDYHQWSDYEQQRKLLPHMESVLNKNEIETRYKIVLLTFIADTYGNFGYVIKQMKRLKSLSKLEDIFFNNKEHPNKIDTLANLGLAYGKQGDVMKKRNI